MISMVFSPVNATTPLRPHGTLLTGNNVYYLAAMRRFGSRLIGTLDLKPRRAP
jgi:hypothetical protein